MGNTKYLFQMDHAKKLKIDKTTYKKSLSYDSEVLMTNDGKKLPFWKVKMEIEELDIKMSSYDDVDFCFSWDNSTAKDSS
jgi:hypothetical protein